MATRTPTRGLSVGPERAALIRGRVTEIATALKIPAPAIDGAMSSDAKLIAFAEATGQSLDWIVFGTPACMIRLLADPEGMMASKRGKAAAWLAGIAAGYRGHPMHMPAGFDVRRWLEGWREGRELRRAMSVSWCEQA